MVAVRGREKVMTGRQPTPDEAEGMSWFNGLSETQRAYWLDLAWKRESPKYTLDSMPSAADAWRWFKLLRSAADLASVTAELPEASSDKASNREWIIQRCINAFRSEYQDWPEYCERLMTKAEMMRALEECEERWPEHEFRGHNVANQRPGRDKPRLVR